MRDMQLNFYLDTLKLYKEKLVPKEHFNQLYKMILSDSLSHKEELTTDHLTLIRMTEYHYASIEEFKTADVLKKIIDNCLLKLKNPWILNNRVKGFLRIKSSV